ncbi:MULTISPECIES: hypothetical protein [Streptomyces]|jgi:hypothetical protein|uniref:PH domain-containing protein n=1 Tax=Streptomyces mirabilis TaxID=68239 RepID=A0ABU3UJU9_9ACTN|nr:MULTISPECIES: hypothetical protein [Streptomyces]MCX5352315.1 hypothetical protein [Streptomyces mirabilis]MDU8994200.1 hypothetical protein [Streptomyces mirabilis]QDN90434.1 hypothetical protein FNV61_37000 [Streptomyces sp. RLB3-6]QDO11280.1 hypothetical protein FNV68_38170 [Streptomyces sp. S1D4-23]
MELLPWRVNRVANSAPGVIPAVVAIAYLAQAGGILPRLLACLSLIGFAVIAVRGYRLGVRCEHRTLVVRGYLRTRVIARESITGITDFPAVRWTTPRGRKRWTPITAFMTNTTEISVSRRHKAQAVGKLRRWARR